MCTVTFLPRRSGYALGMNRDEKLTRVTALPPARHRVGGREVVYPAEPGGGTWMGLNDAGVCLALINWYSVPERVTEKPISRGGVVKGLVAAGKPDFVDVAVAAKMLERVNPFRLIGVFPGPRLVIEWRWNLKQLERQVHPWKRQIWISSGFDETGAQQTRRKIFTEALQEEARGSIAWLRRLHRSHEPERGPYAICMHREDAATVSYTEATVSRNGATLRYQPGLPCAGKPESLHNLKLRHSASGPRAENALLKSWKNR